jgi:hypothetical protein
MRKVAMVWFLCLILLNSFACVSALAESGHEHHNHDKKCKSLKMLKGREWQTAQVTNGPDIMEVHDS